MTDIRVFVLISAMVYFVLAAVLEGILIAEYFKRKEKFRGGILGYGVALVVITIFFILHIYRSFVVPLVWINWICLFLVFLANVLIILTSLRYFGYLNKKLFFFAPIFTVSIIIIEILRLLYVNKSFEIYTAATMLTATPFAYFMIVGFLINSSGEKK